MRVKIRLEEPVDASIMPPKRVEIEKKKKQSSRDERRIKAKSIRSLQPDLQRLTKPKTKKEPPGPALANKANRLET